MSDLRMKSVARWFYKKHSQPLLKMTYVYKQKIRTLNKMTKKEIYAQLIIGGKIERHEYMKFKRNKLVRGTAYEYKLNGEKVTEKQFNEMYHDLTPIPTGQYNVKAYQLTEYLDDKPF